MGWTFRTPGLGADSPECQVYRPPTHPANRLWHFVCKEISPVFTARADSLWSEWLLRKYEENRLKTRPQTSDEILRESWVGFRVWVVGSTPGVLCQRLPNIFFSKLYWAIISFSKISSCVQCGKFLSFRSAGCLFLVQHDAFHRQQLSGYNQCLPSGTSHNTDVSLSFGREKLDIRETPSTTPETPSCGLWTSAHVTRSRAGYQRKQGRCNLQRGQVQHVR